MRIQDIMSQEIVSIASDATLASARNLMKVESVHHLLVEDGRGVIGVVSERDLVEKPIHQTTRWTLERRGPRQTGARARHSRRG